MSKRSQFTSHHLRAYLALGRAYAKVIEYSFRDDGPRGLRSTAPSFVEFLRERGHNALANVVESVQASPQHALPDSRSADFRNSLKELEGLS